MIKRERFISRLLASECLAQISVEWDTRNQKLTSCYDDFWFDDVDVSGAEDVEVRHPARVLVLADVYVRDLKKRSSTGHWTQSDHTTDTRLRPRNMPSIKGHDGQEFWILPRMVTIRAVVVDFRSFTRWYQKIRIVVMPMPGVVY